MRTGSADGKQFRATVEHNIDLVIAEERDRIVGEIRMAECPHDSRSHCLEELCYIHESGGYNEAVKDIINLITNSKK